MNMSKIAECPDASDGVHKLDRCFLPLAPNSEFYVCRNCNSMFTQREVQPLLRRGDEQQQVSTATDPA